MLKGQKATEWGDIHMKFYDKVYEGDIPLLILASWWVSEFIQQILYFSLATWQHRDNYLHYKKEKAQKIQNWLDAVKAMAQ